MLESLLSQSILRVPSTNNKRMSRSRAPTLIEKLPQEAAQQFTLIAYLFSPVPVRRASWPDTEIT
jgi:hypothetical protein